MKALWVFNQSEHQFVVKAVARVVITFVALLSLILVQHAAAQGSSEGLGRDASGRAGSGAEELGRRALERARDEQKNRYRGGVQDEEEVKRNMDELFEKLLPKDGSTDMDVYYSPHVRDLQLDRGTRQQVQRMRDDSVWPMSTDYPPMTKDSDFRLCCVRRQEKNWPTRQIVMAHLKGDGWSPMVEVSYPTRVTGYENQQTESMIVTKEFVDKEKQEVDEMMKGEDAKKWVKGGIERELEYADKAGQNNGAGATTAGNNNQQEAQKAEQLIQQDLRDIQDKIKKENRFTDSIEYNRAFTVRPNFATMRRENRQKIAKEFCFGEKQFMKLMNPNQQEDPKQKKPQNANSDDIDEFLRKIPPFCSYCKNGRTLMIDPQETLKLKNYHNTPTDFVKGMQNGWMKDKLYCQARHAEDESFTTDKLKEVIKKVSPNAPSEQEVGYTCRNEGKSWTGLVPVTLGRVTQVERRAPELALSFKIAAGLYDTQKGGGDRVKTADANDEKSYYKHFEPMPYFKYEGVKPEISSGDKNEFKDQCKRELKGEDRRGKEQPDMMYLSNKTHKFVQEVVKDEKRYMRPWTEDGNTPLRGFDHNVQNYSTELTNFRLCPEGYEKWQPSGDPDLPGQVRARLPQLCGDEKLW